MRHAPARLRCVRAGKMEPCTPSTCLGTYDRYRDRATISLNRVGGTATRRSYVFAINRQVRVWAPSRAVRTPLPSPFVRTVTTACSGGFMVAPRRHNTAPAACTSRRLRSPAAGCAALVVPPRSMSPKAFQLQAWKFITFLSNQTLLVSAAASLLACGHPASALLLAHPRTGPAGPTSTP